MQFRASMQCAFCCATSLIEHVCFNGVRNVAPVSERVLHIDADQYCVNNSCNLDQLYAAGPKLVMMRVVQHMGSKSLKVAQANFRHGSDDYNSSRDVTAKPQQQH